MIFKPRALPPIRPTTPVSLPTVDGTQAYRPKPAEVTRSGIKVGR